LAKVEANQEGMEAPMDASLKTTKTYVQKIEANRGRIETKMETCLEKTQWKLSEYWKTDVGIKI
jgi:hypothetical protein